MKISNKNLKAGFTLVEILVVLVIIAIIAAFATPAMNSMIGGSKMSLGAEGLGRDMNLARQVAVRDNVPVEFRIYNINDPDQPGNDKKWRSYQAITKNYDPTNPELVTVEAVTEVKDLPDGLIFHPSTLSSVLTERGPISSSVSTDTNGEAEKVRQEAYTAFIFMPNGSTSLAKQGLGKLWYLTIVREQEENSSEPKEMAVVQIDPFTGKITQFIK